MFFCFSCDEKLNIHQLSTKNKIGETQILISTSLTSKNLFIFNVLNQKIEESSELHLLQNLANIGYITGKKNLQEVIVLGKVIQKDNLISALPIGIVRLVKGEIYKEWYVFATIESEICDLEDLILNHSILKNQLQHQLILGYSNNFTSVSWLDEAYLELKISELL